jgi:hypothetical protein
MPIQISAISCTPRHAPLAACLAAALGLTLSIAEAGQTPNASAKSHGAIWHTPDSVPSIRSVSNCNDDGSPGSLREVIAAANSGDTIDLSQLVCSTITLSQQLAIKVNQDSLYLQGPATGTLTIDAASQSSVFYHFGAGTFGASHLTITNGYYSGAYGSVPSGGGIYSKGNVKLTSSTVSQCKVVSSSGNSSARGAGVYTEGDLTLISSTITDSRAVGLSGSKANGGGAFVVGYFSAHDSTISDNVAAAAGNAYGYNGGVLAGGGVYIRGSTISGNQADYYGGIALNGGAASTATIVDSTISSNFASMGFAGIWTNSPVTLANSTVAFNRSFANALHSEGVYSITAPITLQSSIIADNSGADGQSDLGGGPSATVTGSDNLVTSSTLTLPMGTHTACPQLGPLTNNGGTTRTHALMHTSPAIDQGHPTPGVLLDQRQAPRMAGAQVDIGSVERQPGETDDRVFVSGFDALCDQ